MDGRIKYFYEDILFFHQVIVILFLWLKFLFKSSAFSFLGWCMPVRGVTVGDVRGLMGGVIVGGSILGVAMGVARDGLPTFVRSKSDIMLEPVYHSDKTFEEIPFSGKMLVGREFEYCTFVRMDFSNSVLKNCLFTGCVFEHCNLSMARMDNSSLTDVSFVHCKVMGVDFSGASSFNFSVRFEHCVLDYAGFLRRKMRKTVFMDCRIVEASFEDADLTESCFVRCDLSSAVFLNSTLQGVDFRTAVGFSIDPEMNRMKKARFSLEGLRGLVGKYQLVIE